MFKSLFSPYLTEAVLTLLENLETLSLVTTLQSGMLGNLPSFADGKRTISPVEKESGGWPQFPRRLFGTEVQ